MDTPYTFVQLVQLFFKACALNHENSNKKMCDGFYRDKDEKYFRNIFNRDKTKGTMVCYRKDKGHPLPHGDKRSPINAKKESDRREGLFFYPLSLIL